MGINIWDYCHGRCLAGVHRGRGRGGIHSKIPVLPVPGDLRGSADPWNTCREESAIVCPLQASSAGCHLLYLAMSAEITASPAVLEIFSVSVSPTFVQTINPRSR